jgi:hypothetical protein
MKYMPSVTVAVLLTVFSIRTDSAQPPAEDFVSFQVTARYLTNVILLVPTDATEADLTKLVSALRSARAAGSFLKFFPPTTPNSSYGPYAGVELFIMSDPSWATTPRLQSFMAPKTNAISATEKEFGSRVRAHYFFTSVAKQEIGTIGFEDDGYMYTARYKKLF